MIEPVQPGRAGRGRPGRSAPRSPGCRRGRRRTPSPDSRSPDAGRRWPRNHFGAPSPSRSQTAGGAFQAEFVPAGAPRAGCRRHPPPPANSRRRCARSQSRGCPRTLAADKSRPPIPVEVRHHMVHQVGGRGEGPDQVPVPGIDGQQPAAACRTRSPRSRVLPAPGRARHLVFPVPDPVGPPPGRPAIPPRARSAPPGRPRRADAACRRHCGRLPAPRGGHQGRGRRRRREDAPTGRDDCGGKVELGQVAEHAVVPEVDSRRAFVDPHHRDRPTPRPTGRRKCPAVGQQLRLVGWPRARHGAQGKHQGQGGTSGRGRSSSREICTRREVEISARQPSTGRSGVEAQPRHQFDQQLAGRVGDHGARPKMAAAPCSLRKA